MSDRPVCERRRGQIDEQNRDHDADRQPALSRVYRHGGYRQRKICGGNGNRALDSAVPRGIIGLADIASPRLLGATDQLCPVHRHTDKVERARE